MRHLEWSDIDWRDGEIRVRQKQVQETLTIPVPNNALAGLKKRMAKKMSGDPVFRDGAEPGAFGVRLDISRMRDLLALKVGEVDLTTCRITMTRIYTWKPKGTNGVVPMCGAVKDLLSRMAEHKTSNFVFSHWDGGSCRMNLLTLLKKAQKKAGIKGRLRIHDLRHTLAVRLRRDKGVPLETIMGILRHADIKETLIYAPFSIDEGREAMSRLDMK